MNPNEGKGKEEDSRQVKSHPQYLFLGEID